MSLNSCKAKPKALLFDVFGTVVNWRKAIAAALSEVADKYAHQIDAEQVADSWRALYQPFMEEVRSGRRPFTILDELHAESLQIILQKYDFPTLSIEDKTYLVTAWHRLSGWEDSSSALARLKRDFIIAPQSNGNIALITNMSKFSQLPWDVVLGAEVVSHYKPCPEAYLGACAKLGLETSSCMMVAAHNDDLSAAQAQGLMTAFICRPTEHGPNQTTDLSATGNWDICATDFHDLADQLERMR